MKKYLYTILLFIFPGSIVFPSQLQETYMVPMRDGVKLATDVFRPGDDVVLQVPVEQNEPLAEPGDADGEVAVSLGALLGLPEFLGGHDVELQLSDPAFQARPTRSTIRSIFSGFLR